MALPDPPNVRPPPTESDLQEQRYGRYSLSDLIEILRYGRGFAVSAAPCTSDTEDFFAAPIGENSVRLVRAASAWAQANNTLGGSGQNFAAIYVKNRAGDLSYREALSIIPPNGEIGDAIVIAKDIILWPGDNIGYECYAAPIGGMVEYLDINIKQLRP